MAALEFPVTITAPTEREALDLASAMRAALDGTFSAFAGNDDVTMRLGSHRWVDRAELAHRAAAAIREGDR